MVYGLIREEFNQVTSELEEILQKIASDVASGVIFEKLPPSELLQKTEQYIDNLKGSAAKSEELMMILKPEKTYTISAMCKNFNQTLSTFKDILIQNSPDPPSNSRLAFEQLRKALADGSDFLLLMRDIRDNPSPLMDALVTLKMASETKGPIINIRASEEVQPLVKYVLRHIDALRAAVVGLEKKIGKIKQIMREIQEDSLKTLSSEARIESGKDDVGNQSEQLSLSNFKAKED